MKNRTVTVCRAVTALLVMLFLSACTGKTEERTEITFIHGWGSSEPDHVVMRQIYADFEQTRPDIKLNLISMPSADDVISKVQDMLTVGEIPDVVFTAGAGEERLYSYMVEKGYALDLFPFLEEDAGFRACIPDAALSRWQEEDGSLYTVSDVLLMSGCWINEDIFERAGIEEVPQTWDEFIQVCRRIREWAMESGSGVTPIVLDEECLLYLADALMEDADGNALRMLAQGERTAENPEYRGMIRRLQQIGSYADMEKQFTYRDTLEMFNAGMSAMYVNGVWASTMIRGDLRVSYAAFPSEDKTGCACISSCVGYILGNTGDQKKNEAGVAFLRYMLSDEVQQRILMETGQIVSSPRIDIAAISDNERLLQAVSCVQSAGHIIEVPENLWRSDAKERFLRYLLGNL